MTHLLTLRCSLRDFCVLYSDVSERDESQSEVGHMARIRSKQVSIGIDDRRKAKLRKLAKEDGRSLSSYVGRLIETHLSEQDTRAA